MEPRPRKQKKSTSKRTRIVAAKKRTEYVLSCCTGKATHTYKIQARHYFEALVKAGDKIMRTKKLGIFKSYELRDPDGRVIPQIDVFLKDEDEL